MVNFSIGTSTHLTIAHFTCNARLVTFFWLCFEQFRLWRTFFVFLDEFLVDIGRWLMSSVKFGPVRSDTKISENASVINWLQMRSVQFFLRKMIILHYKMNHCEKNVLKFLLANELKWMNGWLSETETTNYSSRLSFWHSCTAENCYCFRLCFVHASNYFLYRIHQM